MRTFVVSLSNTSDRVVGPEAAGIPRRLCERDVGLLSAHPWIYSVSQRQESLTLSAAIRSRREVDLSSSATWPVAVIREAVGRR